MGFYVNPGVGRDAARLPDPVWIGYPPRVAPSWSSTSAPPSPRSGRRQGVQQLKNTARAYGGMDMLASVIGLSLEHRSC
jgi:hypothetical protein